MESNQQPTNNQKLSKKLLLWPGIILVILQWFMRFVLPIFAPSLTNISVLSALFFGLLVIIWWAFFSRALGLERLAGVVLMIVALIVTFNIIDKSISTGMQGMMFFVFAMPILCLAFVIWAVATRNLTNKLRRVFMTLTILLSVGVWTLFRSDGMSGEAKVDFEWRWSKTAEEKLLAQSPENLLATEVDSLLMITEAEWPGFRGKNRDGIVYGTNISTDWSETPPVEMWKKSIGPGCSSFAMHGSRFYTQEQRGDEEIVSCYDLNTGEPIWMHSDSARFWDSHAGAGPRSTPTLFKGKVYTLGATGILNILNESDGSLIWSHNAAGDTDVKIPGWGYTSSPIVTDDVVVVAVSGTLVAYDSKSKDLLWISSDTIECYGSPHLMTIDSVEQIVMMNSSGATGYSPYDGKVLWEYPLKAVRILQPAQILNNDILIDAGERKGLHRLEVKHESNKWIVAKVWSTNRMRPDFNDFCIHNGFIYGLDGYNLMCIDINDGSRKWKGERYGGQIILLADQDLILTLSEKGEVILAKATPESYTELGHFQAIEGKTWNHPILVNDILLVRNTEEMAAIRLPSGNS